MHKVLKVAVTEEKGQKFIQIVEQSHRGDAFGIKSSKFSHEFNKNTFTLLSKICPVPYRCSYFVCGSAVEYDKDICPVPSDEWLTDCLATIDAYNEYEFEE